MAFLSAICGVHAFNLTCVDLVSDGEEVSLLVGELRGGGRAAGLCDGAHEGRHVVVPLRLLRQLRPLHHLLLRRRVRNRHHREVYRDQLKGGP